MACGCKQTMPVSQAVAAMCHLCPWAEHGPSAWADGAIACTVDGKPVAGRVACPRGVWKDGLVRFVFRFRGVPIFHRLIYRVAYGIPLKKWVGCGCLDGVKRVYEKPPER